MNYQLHYNNLIERAKTRLLVGYSERHHIIPKCMGGSDEKDNLVNLTAEEHYVAHQLLVRLHPKHRGLVEAASLMTVDKDGNRVHNKMYGWLKRRLSEARTGWKHTEETKTKMSAWQIGKKLSDEHKQKISETLTGRVFSEEHKYNLSLLHKGRVLSKEHRQKLSASHKGKKQVRICCPHCDTVGGQSNMKRWHFDNCKLKEEIMLKTM